MDIHPSAIIATTARIDRTWPRGIHIREGCIIEDEVIILSHDFSRGLYLDTVVSARCKLGARVIVLPGITIGEDSIVMPGTLLAKDVPPDMVAIGNPAKFYLKDGFEIDVEIKA